MTQSPTDQHCGLRPHGCPDEGVDLKLLRNSQSVERSAWACCHLKACFARLGALLAFHLLNALLAISGAGLVLALTVLSVALFPVMLMAFALVVWKEATTERFPNWNWRTITVVLLALSVTVIVLPAILFNWWGPFWVFSLLLWMPPFQRDFVILNEIAVNRLALLDVKLANFVVPSMPSKSKPHSAIRRAEIASCTRDQTELPEGSHCLWFDEELVLNVFTTPATRSAVFYFLLPKLLIGVLSSISVMLGMVLPVLVFVGNGRIPWVVNRDTFQEDPIVYIGATVTFWLLGVLGIILVAVWSVHLTIWGCGECEREQQVQEEHNTPRMSSSGVTAVSFVELEDP
ncbi:hypothetical protein BBJ28_00024328 [Nothophytophthora sp. Chile5]|nr:hypothetical protein BBJ28_00024328 [Nothophytophthora sp. Chile5]